MKFSILILLFSTFSFALEVGQDIELTDYMNARYSAKFRKTDKNVMGTIEKGTKGTVKEVRPLPSGNSGVLIEVLDGNLKSQKVWVYYNEKAPLLALVNKDKVPVTKPDDAAAATAIAPVPVVREPATGPGVSLSDADRALQAIAVVNKPGSTSDCQLCKPAASGETRLTSSVTEAGDLNAKMKCNYAGDYGAIPGSIEVEIVNNEVKNLNAKINGCNVTLEEFKQVHFDNKNIVLKNANGCTVVLGVYDKVRSATPAVHFGMVPTQDCVNFCKPVERKFWQAEMNPSSNSCF